MEFERLYYIKSIMSEAPYDVYSYLEYKTLLKERLSFLRKQKPALSWRSIAEKIPIQATYLSKSLNDSKTHLSEDDLFRICQWLDFKSNEVEFVLLLRSSNTTNDRDRKDYLGKKIQDIKKKRIISAEYVEAQVQNLTNEMIYLLDPVTVLIHAALFISKYKKDPLLLCPQLGISQAKLKKSLQSLSNCEFVELGKKAFEVTSVSLKAFHFGREHPLTRTHQTGLKSSLTSRLNQTSEEQKESFIVTFTMDEKGFNATKEAFADFIKKVQSITKSSRHEKLYQLNFDLLEWF